MVKPGDTVRQQIPGHDSEPMKSRIKRPTVHGEHLAYHDCTGVVVALAGNGGAWVRFDGTDRYVGCPVEWLTVQ